MDTKFHQSNRDEAWKPLTAPADAAAPSAQLVLLQPLPLLPLLSPDLDRLQPLSCHGQQASAVTKTHLLFIRLPHGEKEQWWFSPAQLGINNMSILLNHDQF